LLKDHRLQNGLVIFRLIGFLEAAGWAGFSIYFPIYLESLGISYFQIGIIAAAPTIIGMFAGVAWSSYSDYIGKRRPFMIQSALSSSILISLTTLLSSFEWFLALGILRGLLTPVLEGLTVANLFELSDRKVMGRVFGSYAMWKSIGWAVSAIIAGTLSQLFGLRAALYLSSLMFFMITVAALRVPEPTEDSSPRISRAQINFAPLRMALDTLCQREFARFLFASLPIYLSINAMAIFFPVYMKTAEAAPLLIGATFTVPAFFEVLVFLKIGRIADTVGGKRRLLVLSSSIYLLLFLIIGSARNPLILFLAYSMLNPLAWPSLFTASSALISKLLPAQRWAIGQTLYRIWSWSLSSVLGSLIGGWISEAISMPSMFIIMSILAAFSSALFTRIKETASNPLP